MGTSVFLSGASPWVPGSVSLDQIAVGSGIGIAGSAEFQVQPEGTGDVLRFGGAAFPPAGTGFTWPDYATVLALKSGDYGDVTIAATSDGFAGAQTTYAFVAQAGDVDTAGSPIPAGNIAMLGFMYAQREDTTVAHSGDMGLSLGVVPDIGYALLTNAVGDVGVGRVTSTFDATPTPISAANLKIDGATGNTTAVGTVKGTSVFASSTNGFVGVQNRFYIDAATDGNVTVHNWAGTLPANIEQGVPKFSGANSTGAGITLLGSNSPATIVSAPYTWVTVTAADGTVCYLPIWK